MKSCDPAENAAEFCATHARQRELQFSLFALLLPVSKLPWVWQVTGPTQILQIIIIAPFAIVGQFCYAKAFSLALGGKVNTWIYMSLVFAMIIGFVVWDEPVFLTTLVGAGLVSAGAVLASRPGA